MKLELVINLKAAKQIGLTIPRKGAGQSRQGDQVTTVSARHYESIKL
jgi:hypothetical protein